MHWIHLTDEAQLKNILCRSQEKPQVIFKHSTRCSISSVAFKRLQVVDPTSNIDFYLMDLIAYRELSNKVSQVFHVHHESPQVLVIKDGECIYDESHLGIRMEDILESVMAK
jgi:bacillithiol system protein YtxJ